MADQGSEFVARLQASDPSAYEELIENYADLIFRITYRILGNEQDAEDAMQETFLTVYRRIADFRGESKFTSWLYRVATNVALDLLRSRKSKQKNLVPLEKDDEMESVIIADIKPLPEHVLTQKEMRERINRTLADMSPKLSEAFILYEINGLTMKETATVLGISESAAKLRVHRARLLLQKALTDCMLEVES